MNAYSRAWALFRDMPRPHQWYVAAGVAVVVLGLLAAVSGLTWTVTGWAYDRRQAAGDAERVKLQVKVDEQAKALQTAKTEAAIEHARAEALSARVAAADQVTRAAGEAINKEAEEYEAEKLADDERTRDMSADELGALVRADLDKAGSDAAIKRRDLQRGGAARHP